MKSDKPSATTDRYDSTSIKVLKGIEGVRRRPSMYIGGVGSRGLHHLAFEVVDNSVDEGLAATATTCEVRLLPNGYVSISDDGRGIPADIHPEYGVSALEVIMTNLHSGGKFDNKAYKVSGGLHGVGLTAVNALSEHMIIEIVKNGFYYHQEYRMGVKASEVLKTKIDTAGEFLLLQGHPVLANGHGSLITFKPDPTIFEVTEFEHEIINSRMQELAYLTPNMTFLLRDNRDEDDQKLTTYHYDGGLSEFVLYLNSLKRQEFLIPGLAKIFSATASSEGIEVELALTWNKGYSEVVIGFANNISTDEGGSHISGFRTGLTRTLNEFGRNRGILKDKERNLQGQYLRQGLVAVISVKVPDPQFEGQTKTKLVNSAVDRIVQRVVQQEFGSWIEKESQLAKELLMKSLSERKIQSALRKRLELSRQQASGRVSLPGKLVPCREKDPAKRELFLVEGMSAGGTAVKARDNQFQEILFLRGKVLNVEKATLGRALDNQEIRNIITAIGAGISTGHQSADDDENGGDKDFELEKCRYGKVILLSDADVDGAHISTLLLTLFFRYMRGLLEDGRVYVARPPLFRVSLRGRMDENAKELFGTKSYNYFHSDEAKDTFVEKLAALSIPPRRIMIQRYKGLGEMNPDQLEETAMAPATRRLERLVIDNSFRAETTFSVLMGEDVTRRKAFIAERVFKDSSQEAGVMLYKDALTTEIQKDVEPDGDFEDGSSDDDLGGDTEPGGDFRDASPDEDDSREDIEPGDDFGGGSSDTNLGDVNK